jgi:outer membrane protein OmpA-like peptidoglycan-associated protein
MSSYGNSKQTGEDKMKKVIFFVIFAFLTLSLTANQKEAKKIYKLKKAYVYLDESLLISDSDLNCTYFIKDSMPQDIRIVESYQSVIQRKDYSDSDSLVVNKGSKDGLKEGDMLLVMSEEKFIADLGYYYLKKSLAEITGIYEHRAVIQLKNGCNPVRIGDFAILFKPEKTVFAKKIDYLFARVPENSVNGNVVYTDLTLGMPAAITATCQYVTVDLGAGVVAKGTSLLIYRMVKKDLPPLIIGLGMVIQAENTNSTVKILDANSDISINDKVLILPAINEKDLDIAETAKTESIPIIEALQVESQEKENAQPEIQPQAGAVQPEEQKGNTLTVDVLFAFNSKKPKADHRADFTAIKEFIVANPEYLVTLRGYSCSIGSEEYNLRLTKERVEAIKNILIAQCGVDAAHVEMFFYGEKESRFDNSSEAERQKNRLVKIEVIGK